MQYVCTKVVLESEAIGFDWFEMLSRRRTLAEQVLEPLN